MASVNPSYLREFGPDAHEEISLFLEEHGADVLHTSIGWDDLHYKFDSGSLVQNTEHLWHVLAFFTDSDGNDGKNGGMETMFL